MTGALTATTATTATTTHGDFVVADALHHVAARCFGGCGHHITAWRLSCAAPQGLATHGDGLGNFAWLGAKAFEQLHWNLLLGEALDVHHEAFFIQADQADRLAAGARAACAANAVHVVFRHVGDFKVHDVRQVFDVDTARSNVCGHQSADLAAFEASQRLSAGRLAFVAVQGHGLDAVFGQEVGHIVRAKLGAREHQHLAPVVLLDDVQQHVFFLAAAHRVDHLRDALHRGVAGRDLDALGVLEQVGGQLADLVAEGGREQQALLVFRHKGQHFFLVMDEAHVQHAVGFVEHQNFNAGQVQKALTLQIEQAAGCGHQNVHALFDLADLRVHAHATKDHGGVELQVFAVIAHRLFDLSGQFAGGGEDQSADGFAANAVFARLTQTQLVQHGQGEGGGFASAGLGASQQVLPSQNGGNGLGLDRRGGFVAELTHRLHEGRSQIQFVKVHFYRAPSPAQVSAHSTAVGSVQCWPIVLKVGM